MNLSPHRKAIAIFSIAVPAILILGLLVGILMGKSKVHQRFSEKEADYLAYEQARRQVAELEALLALDNRREKVAYWNEKLDRDFIQTLSTTLTELLSKYDDEVLRQTEMSKATIAAAIGSKTDHPHSLVQMSFEGGFKPMQLLLAELEAEMPNLILEKLSIRSLPSKVEGEGDKLQFTVIYMGWEKPEA